MKLPPAQRAIALEAVQVLYGGSRRESEAPKAGGPVRDVDQRRSLVGDPWRYIRDVFGYALTVDQEQLLELIETSDRVLAPSGNSTGKTHLLAAYAVYRLDAVAAMPDAELGYEEQGGRILLPGPDHKTIYGTIYSEMMVHARRAEARGYPMPGNRSENSVLWRIRPAWEVEAFSPEQRVGQDVTHGASGRHHRNQVAIVEEGQGVPEPTWAAVEGMCSGEGNKIISAFNPTEPRGPAYRRSTMPRWTVHVMSALNHPNVVHRRPIVAGAIAASVIDARIREECLDMGPASETIPDPTEYDFVYALPALGVEEQGERQDGIRGHPLATPHVYRPGGLFAPQVLGRFPKSTTASLFDPVALEQASARWRSRSAPSTPPDMVGVDPAREGRDRSCTAARWGEDAEALLREFAAAKELGDGALEAVIKLREDRRQYVGRIAEIAKGDGVDTATALCQRYPDSPFAIDDGGIGASVFDHVVRVIGREASPISFGGSPQPVTPGEPWSENTRTQLYVRAALLVAAGLADVPDDSDLREELLAHRTKPRSRTVVERGEDGLERKVRRSSVLLIDKDEIRKLIGRSPDRADAFVLAVNGDPSPKPTKWELW